MIHRFAIGALATITITLILADVMLIALPRTTAAPDVYGLSGIGVVFAVVCTSLGGAIALRQPSNSVGWIYLSSGRACKRSWTAVSTALGTMRRARSTRSRGDSAVTSTSTQCALTSSASCTTRSIRRTPVSGCADRGDEERCSFSKRCTSCRWSPWSLYSSVANSSIRSRTGDVTCARWRLSTGPGCKPASPSWAW